MKCDVRKTSEPECVDEDPRPSRVQTRYLTLLTQHNPDPILRWLGPHVLAPMDLLPSTNGCEK